MTKKFEKNRLGFKKYGELVDAQDSCVQILETSREEPQVWLITDNDRHGPGAVPCLTAKHAEELVKILQDFIEDVRDPQKSQHLL